MKRLEAKANVRMEMTKFSRESIYKLLFGLAILPTGIALVKAILWLFNITDKLPELNAAVLPLAIPMLALIAMGAFINTLRLKDEVYWLVSILRERDVKRTAESGVPLQADQSLDLNLRQKWPWGDHHTEMLGHLEAAGKRYWMNYDPSDISTAPTNTMVAEWLQSERGVSNDKAKAIASILRPENLRTGPR